VSEQDGLERINNECCIAREAEMAKCGCLWEVDYQGLQSFRTGITLRLAGMGRAVGPWGGKRRQLRVGEKDTLRWTTCCWGTDGGGFVFELEDVGAMVLSCFLGNVSLV
jgi:hypothetical protein